MTCHCLLAPISGLFYDNQATDMSHPFLFFFPYLRISATHIHCDFYLVFTLPKVITSWKDFSMEKQTSPLDDIDQQEKTTTHDLQGFFFSQTRRGSSTISRSFSTRISKILVQLIQVHSSSTPLDDRKI